MNQTEFAYTATAAKTVAEAIRDLEQALAERKFNAMWHLDVRDRLREKGLEFDREFHIFEVCNAPSAKRALETNIRVGYFLPCKIVVYTEDGETRIGMVRPTLLMDMLGEPQLEALARSVDEELRAAVDAAALSST